MKEHKINLALEILNEIIAAADAANENWIEINYNNGEDYYSYFDGDERKIINSALDVLSGLVEDREV